MTPELAVAIFAFLLMAFGFLFSLARTSSVESGSFPNRGRFFIGLILWLLAAILAVFMSFPGYADWFVPEVYPALKIAFLALLVIGFFLLLTTVVAFPGHLDYWRREIGGRSDRITLLENIRQIVAQPYPMTESFGLVLREVASFLVAQKGAAFLINPSRREMYLVAQIGLDKEEWRRLERFPMGQDIISRAAAEQAPFVSGDLAASDPATRKLILAGRELTYSAAAVPLSSRDRSLGAILVLADRPLGFEKRDRMLLSAAAEALATLVENNRLSRENQKILQEMDQLSGRLQGLRHLLGLLGRTEETRQIVKEGCRLIVERYGVPVARVVSLIEGRLNEVAAFETGPAAGPNSESYRIAVIDAIRRGKMVILSQEARAQDGSSYVARSTFLCPVTVNAPAAFALLVEAPGEGLKITDGFLADVETLVNLVAADVSMAEMAAADRFNRISVRALTDILKLKPDLPEPVLLRRFIEELQPAISPHTAVLIFGRDDQAGYRLRDGCHVVLDAVGDVSFIPGEGPVGKAAVSGEMIELTEAEAVREAWGDLEPPNQDFLGRLFGEQKFPPLQLFLPIRALEETAGVIAVFSRAEKPGFKMREKGIILLAAQLLSIKLSMAEIDAGWPAELSGAASERTGHALNRINNDLSTILGRAQLMARQSDTSGQARYAAEEIIKAAESAASSVRRLQAEIDHSETALPSKSDNLYRRVKSLVDGHQLTGNLYMWDGHHPVTLETDLEAIDIDLVEADVLYAPLEAIIKGFIPLVEETEELAILARRTSDSIYLAIIHGPHERIVRFDPRGIDYGEADVAPKEWLDDKHLIDMNRHRVRVSFDRFGRRPTYFAFQIPIGGTVPAAAGSDTSGRSDSGLRLLAIDDQQMILDLLNGICTSLGLQLDAVQDAARGIAMFAKGKYDLVMVDLVLGDISGWEVTRKIKEISPETPVIMMTGWGMKIAPEEAARRGVDFTLSKPFRIEQLTEVISQARARRISS